MKTIADYQPHELIATGIDALRYHPNPALDAQLVLVAQVAYDMRSQGIKVSGAATEWVEQALDAHREQ